LFDPLVVCYCGSNRIYIHINVCVSINIVGLYKRVYVGYVHFKVPPKKSAFDGETSLVAAYTYFLSNYIWWRIVFFVIYLFLVLLWVSLLEWKFLSINL